MSKRGTPFWDGGKGVQNKNLQISISMSRQWFLTSQFKQAIAILSMTCNCQEGATTGVQYIT